MLHPLVKCGIQSTTLIAPIASYKHLNDNAKPIFLPVLAHFVSCSIIEYTKIFSTNTSGYSESIVNMGATIAGVTKTSIMSTEVMNTSPSSFVSGILNALAYHHKADLKPSATENSSSANLLFYIAPVIIETSCNFISSKGIYQGIEAGVYLSFPLFPIYNKAVEYLEGTSFGEYDPTIDPIVNTDLFVENVKICTTQSITIAAPVMAAITYGVEVGLKGNKNPKSVGKAAYLNVASISAAHFTKCMAASIAKPASDSEIYHTSIDTLSGVAKYAAVDYLHPDKSISLSRLISGSWNGFGYNKAHLIEDNLNTSLVLSPLFVEPIDGLIGESIEYIVDMIQKEGSSNANPTLGAVIGGAAGILVTASINYAYIPTLEYISTEDKKIEESGDITTHEEL
jgi:hypothetical protein